MAFNSLCLPNLYPCCVPRILVTLIKFLRVSAMPFLTLMPIDHGYRVSQVDSKLTFMPRI
jgi:hypothetical protein